MYTELCHINSYYIIHINSEVSFALEFGDGFLLGKRFVRLKAQIGPFELDPATRRSLDNALGLGGSRLAR